MMDISPGMLVGFDEEKKGYRVYVPSEKRIIVSAHVQIDENTMYSCNMENPVASSLTDSLLDPFKERDNDHDGDMKNLEHRKENNSSESDYEENKEQDIHELEAEEEMPMLEANVPLVIDRNVTDAQLVGVHPEAKPENEREQMLPQENDEAPLRRSHRTRKKVKRLGLPTSDDEAMSAMMLDHDLSKSFSPVSVLSIDKRHIPTNNKEAVSCPEASFWKEAIKNEHNSLM